MSELPPDAVLIREAFSSDLPTIVEYNRLLALETESKTLDPDILALGVSQAIADPDRAPLAGCNHGADHQIQIGQPCDPPASRSRLARNGWIWWFQSVYVAGPFRRQGIFRALYRHIHGVARSRPDVIGLRLYVEDANARAQETYRSLGMKPGGYSVYQDLWIPGASSR